MHELAVTESIVNIVVDQAREHGAGKVTRIDLVIGSLQGIVDECVRFHFEVLSKGTVAEGSELNITVAPAMARCRECMHEFELPALERSCPRCANWLLEVVGGNELLIDSIEVD